jgi:hypothetical protein
MIAFDNILIRYSLLLQDFDPHHIDLYIDKTSAGAAAGELDSIESREIVLDSLRQELATDPENPANDLLAFRDLAPMADVLNEHLTALETISNTMTTPSINEFSARAALFRLSEVLRAGS